MCAVCICNHELKIVLYKTIPYQNLIIKSEFTSNPNRTNHLQVGLLDKYCQYSAKHLPSRLIFLQTP